jgi:hypothetical protein
MQNKYHRDEFLLVYSFVDIIINSSSCFLSTFYYWKRKYPVKSYYILNALFILVQKSIFACHTKELKVKQEFSALGFRFGDTRPPTSPNILESFHPGRCRFGARRRNAGDGAEFQRKRLTLWNFYSAQKRQFRHKGRRENFSQTEFKLHKRSTPDRFTPQSDPSIAAGQSVCVVQEESGSEVFLRKRARASN